MIISSNAGLWAYNIGDTIKFVSKDPYRIMVTGRVKHFISAFGEHVIGEEAEEALLKAADENEITITEFTVAPFISDSDKKSFHEWFINYMKSVGKLGGQNKVPRLSNDRLVADQIEKWADDSPLLEAGKN